eukprot:10058155-Alexandrium_andersonii.AAC.1
MRWLPAFPFARPSPPSHGSPRPPGTSSSVAGPSAASPGMPGSTLCACSSPPLSGGGLAWPASALSTRALSPTP